jgi:hypothetical protein
MTVIADVCSEGWYVCGTRDCMTQAAGEGGGCYSLLKEKLPIILQAS